MDTNWKKSKLALRILCGWLAALFLIGAVLLACIGQPRHLLGGGANGMADLLAGQVSGSVDYQQRMAQLFYSAAIMAAGAQDTAGQSLTKAQNIQLRTNARQFLTQEFSTAITPSSHEDDLLYYVVRGDQKLASNTSTPLYDEGRIAPPLGYSVALAAHNGQLWGNRALLDAYAAYAAKQPVRPDSGLLQSCVVILAVRDEPLGGSFVYNDWFSVQVLRIALILFFCCAGGALVFGLVCLFQRRRGRAARQWAASLTARVVLELKLAAWLAALFVVWAVRILYYSRTLVLACALLLLWPLGWLTAVDLARNKGGVFRHSLLAKGWRALRQAARLVRQGLPWQRRVFLGVAACWLGSGAAGAFTLLMLFRGGALPFFLGAAAVLALLLAGLWLLVRWLGDMGRLTQKIAALRAGAAGPSLALAASSPLAGPAADLNALEEGIALAVEERGRADRMKVELITNVSHDLKTPLTSIINYSDLLCAEPLEGAAADYAQVIRQKAERLKTMVQDVFDLSKATSGNLPLAPKAIDLAKLVRQTLADMDEAIAASALTFKTTLPPEAWVQADGDRLYRVFQNLFTNALQYSLPGSRVYVELVCENGRAAASVKNVARYEMEFDPAEITERFVRGDAARTGEGSGLGLSIAKSFTEACGGSFSVRAEADLFCASVALDLTEKPAESRQEAPPAPQAPAAETAGAGAL